MPLGCDRKGWRGKKNRKRYRAREEGVLIWDGFFAWVGRSRVCFGFIRVYGRGHFVWDLDRWFIWACCSITCVCGDELRSGDRNRSNSMHRILPCKHFVTLAIDSKHVAFLRYICCEKHFFSILNLEIGVFFFFFFFAFFKVVDQGDWNSWGRYIVLMDHPTFSWWVLWVVCDSWTLLSREQTAIFIIYSHAHRAT